MTADIEWVLAVARRQAWIVLVCTALGVLAGIAFYLFRTPTYTATAVLSIDNKRTRSAQDAYEVLIQGEDQSASFIETQAEILKADPVIFTMIEKLQLYGDTELDPCAQTKPSLLSKLFPKKPSPCLSLDTSKEVREWRQRTMADAINRNIELRRIPKAPMIEISYKSQSPEKAARIANGLIEAYLSDQLQVRFEATRRATAWLQERMVELKEKVLTSDLALQKFKADNNLISSGGRLVLDQQLGELNALLATARADAARAGSRYRQFAAIRQQNRVDSLITESITDAVLLQLRNRYVQAARKEAELLGKLGRDHASVQTVQREMRDIETLMSSEISRLERGYKSELEAAEQRERSLTESVNKLMESNADANKIQVTLRELERESETFKSLYQAILQRYREVLQNQSFPVSESRQTVIARTPTAPSSPKPVPILAAALLLGGLTGAAFAARREYQDRGFRTPSQITSELRLECLGLLPEVERGRRRGALAKSTDEKPVISTAPPVLRHVVENPFSAFAESLASVQVATDMELGSKKPKKIGIVSAMPGEGKTTLVYNIGLLFARMGRRTLLIDADLRNSELTRLAARNSEKGIYSAVIDKEPLTSLLVHDATEPLAILPSVPKEPIPHTWAFLTSPGMQNVIEQAEKEFDVLVFDLPPMGPVVDASAFAPHLDAVVFVVEWGVTPRKLVKSLLSADSRIRDRCLGVLVNKVDMAKLKNYESEGAKEYYFERYGAYYNRAAKA